MSRIDRGELAAGLLICMIGATFLFGSFDYQTGTATRMGPGYLPMVISGIAVGLGMVIVLLSLGRGVPLPQPALRSALAVLFSIAAFAFTLERVGLVPATVLTVIIASFGDRRARPLAILALAAVVAAAAWLVFIVALGLPMRSFRWSV